MNKIDSRFLSFNTTVIGRVNEPQGLMEGSTISEDRTGYQFIVGDYPTGDFAEAHTNDLARYEDGGWTFITPSVDMPPVLDLTRGEMLRYDSSNGWVVIPLNSSGNTFGEGLIRHVLYSMRQSSLSSYPSPNELGDIIYDASENKIYVGQDSTNWYAGKTPDFGLYILDAVLCLYNGSEMVRIDNVGKCLYFVDKGAVNRRTFAPGENTILYYDTGDFYQIYPLDTTSVASEVMTSMARPYTETHTINSNDLNDKEFTLSYNVESGEETNILCFVNGVAQAAGTAFSASNNTLSWNNKTLDGIVNYGDVFIVQYVKASA